MAARGRAARASEAGGIQSRVYLVTSMLHIQNDGVCPYFVTILTVFRR